ncbi:MAG: UDP-N-acetylmuramate dehydrogenase [Blautia glucerasea]|nr:UDP-N-acetylmuramate dehydrogenase [Blautia glucerasea]MDY3086455.1 UDP-N-acetylmuramate dehydrogenase [Blautia sp.]
MKQRLIEELTELLGNDRVLTNEPMSRHTTFRIGGPADLFLLPNTVEEIKKIREICIQEQESYFILGNGSNLLVSDSGFRGVIIQTYRNLAQIQVEEDCIRAQAGALLSGIAQAAKAASLTGFEFAAGIPGTLGGAVVMNAGAYGGEMKDVLKEATVLDSEGQIRRISAGKLAMGYRTSVIKEAGYMVLEAVISLKKGDPDQIRETMKDLTQRRISKQPLEYPSAGSTFKRPEGYFAGKLIMDSGLRGYTHGGAQVSEKHCGFVINTGGATARDVCELMEHVQKTVYEKYNVKLEPEVKFLGDF